MNGHFALSVYAFPATAFMLPRLASSSTYQRMLIGTLALVVRRRRMVEQRYGSLAAMRVMMRASKFWRACSSISLPSLLLPRQVYAGTDGCWSATHAMPLSASSADSPQRCASENKVARRAVDVPGPGTVQYGSVVPPEKAQEIFVIAFLTFLRLFQRGHFRDAFSSLLSRLSSLVSRPLWLKQVSCRPNRRSSSAEIHSDPDPGSTGAAIRAVVVAPVATIGRVMERCSRVLFSRSTVSSI